LFGRDKRRTFAHNHWAIFHARQGTATNQEKKLNETVDTQTVEKE